MYANDYIKTSEFVLVTPIKFIINVSSNNIMDQITTSLATCLIVYVIAEGAWLFSMSSFYSREFQSFSKGPLQIRSPTACVLVYPLIIFSFYYFVLLPLMESKYKIDPFAAFMRGALFGLALYGVYNLTNAATLLGYSWTMVAVDTLWGASLFGFISLVFSLVHNPALQNKKMS